MAAQKHEDLVDRIDAAQRSVARLRPDIREIVRQELTLALSNRYYQPEEEEEASRRRGYHPEEDITW